MIGPTDAAVLARMRAAARVMREAGLEVPDVDPDSDPGLDEPSDRDAHLRRAVHWNRYGAGPVPDLHRRCAADIARGSLRLWSMAGGVPEAPAEPVATQTTVTSVPTRAEIQLARIQLGALVRTRCAALRAELAARAATLSRRGVGGFEDEVRVAALRLAADLDEAVTARLSDLGLSSRCPDPIADFLPPRRRPRLENRLTALLGTGFGAGLSLTVGRLLAGVRPDWMPVTALICGLFGIGLTTWTVLARRLLAERAAAERWMAEALANLRPALEERLLTRTLAAESAGN